VKECIGADPADEQLGAYCGLLNSARVANKRAVQCRCLPDRSGNERIVASWRAFNSARAAEKREEEAVDPINAYAGISNGAAVADKRDVSTIQDLKMYNATAIALGHVKRCYPENNLIEGRIAAYCSLLNSARIAQD
jgi:hypothetical protein